MKQKIIDVIKAHKINKYLIKILIKETDEFNDDDKRVSLCLSTKDVSLYCSFGCSISVLLSYMNWRQRVNIKLNDFLKMLNNK